MRRRIQFYCWVLCGYLSLTGLWAQSLILEQVRIHTDRSLYASGETIWLKLYVTDALAFRPTALSKIAFVELWDLQGDILFQTKVLLEEGLGTATLDIPPTQETGEYLIRAYTRWMANGTPDNFAHQPIIIFNPKQPVPVRDTTQLPQDFRDVFLSRPSASIATKSPEALQINLSPSKTLAESREEVQIEITTKNSQGTPIPARLSLSIAKTFPLEETLLSTSLYTALSGSDQNAEADQLPDLYGLNLSGTVVNALGQGVDGATVFFCLPGKTPVVQYTKSTAEGWFRFLLPELYGNKEILIAARDAKGKGLKVKLDPDILGGRPELPNWSFTFHPAVVEELQAYILQNQIQKAYSPSTSRSINRDPILTSFYGDADHVYVLDEYTRFSMSETFLEIIYSVTLNKRQDRPVARVYNANTKQTMEGAPLILVDGVPVPDIADLLALSSKEVERIEVVTHPYYLYGKVYDGIIHAITYKGQADQVPIPAGAIRKPYAFLSPLPTLPPWQAKNEAIPNSNRIPDMRRLLLWEPMIQTDEEGKARLSFWTSDIEGKFEIKIQGLGDEGLWGEKRVEFEVVGNMP